MTIERGAEWGRLRPQPDDVVEVADDAAAARLIEDCRRAGRSLPPLGLLGGDLRRTFGRAGAVERLPAEVVEVAVDLGVVELAGVERCFVGHLVARRTWWRGEVIVAMNAQFIGAWDVAPRAHPNDGFLDLLRVEDLGVLDRWKARQRLPQGTHVPHPGIGLSRTRAIVLTFDRPLRIHLDGVVVGEAARVAVRVEPDALTVCV